MYKKMKEKVKDRVIAIQRVTFTGENLSVDDLRELINNAIDYVGQEDKMPPTPEQRRQMVGELINEFSGYGPIQCLLDDPAVTEIMINGMNKIYVERNGKKELSSVTFENERQLLWLVNKILIPSRRRVDESYSYTNVSMKDGSRVNIIIPPLALDGPIVTIRKFSKEIKDADDLIKLGTLDERMAEFLVACVRAKANIIFSGATGAGKTTTAGVLSRYIDNSERIITIEDTAELHLSQDHVVRLEAKQANIEGKGEVTIRELFVNSLRMRPERIILGEIRGKEALDMLQAICSGHTGSIAVVHANSPENVIYRLETMILGSGVPLSLENIHRQIAAAVNIIVQQEQLLDGPRKITHIAQTNGLKDGLVVLEDIFTYEFGFGSDKEKMQGRWKATGVKPVFYEMFKKKGVELPVELFNKD